MRGKPPGRSRDQAREKITVVTIASEGSDRGNLQRYKFYRDRFVLCFVLQALNNGRASQKSPAMPIFRGFFPDNIGEK
jgi:hypothetical protein